MRPQSTRRSRHARACTHLTSASFSRLFIFLHSFCPCLCLPRPVALPPPPFSLCNNTLTHPTGGVSALQVLLASKPRLQALLAQLLQQWAVLEPVLLEQQHKKMLAIADSECAICLEPYSEDTPGIRTSCCGYHFHHSCLQSCIDSTGHCPICSAPKGSCKVVQQRRPNATIAPIS